MENNEQKKKDREANFAVAGTGCTVFILAATAVGLLVLFLVNGGWLWLCFILGIIVLYFIFSLFSN